MLAMFAAIAEPQFIEQKEKENTQKNIKYLKAGQYGFIYNQDQNTFSEISGYSKELEKLVVVGRSVAACLRKAKKRFPNADCTNFKTNE